MRKTETLIRLTAETKEKLRQLSAKHDLSQSQVVEKLIIACAKREVAKEAAK